MVKMNTVPDPAPVLVRLPVALATGHPLVVIHTLWMIHCCPHEDTALDRAIVPCPVAVGLPLS